MSYVIAEIGINHNGDIDLAKELIDTAEASGCDAVKFQKRDIDSVYSEDELNKYRESPWGTTTREQKEGIEFILKVGILSFIETERLTMSKEKSSVIHISGRKKCKSVCPKLKVHDSTMKSVESAKYLGDIITSNGSIRATVNDRRARGRGK